MPTVKKYLSKINKEGNDIYIKDIEAEKQNNKVTSISNQSTDSQYPSAKCMYDIVVNLEWDD